MIGPKLLISSISVLLLLVPVSHAQLAPEETGTPSVPPTSIVQPIYRSSSFSIPGKRASQYTAADWGAWIDSTWGPGQGATVQYSIFDNFWNNIDKYWGGFPNLSADWDSIKTMYRAQIGSGISRGRFAGLMSRMWHSLQEFHTLAWDARVDTTFGTVKGYFQKRSSHYVPGVPLLCIGTMSEDLLGAPVTALQDSSGLVYRAVSGNPLGLQPGDVILGYEGIPWKHLYKQLLDYGVPISREWSFPGSTPEADEQLAMSSVGWNWGMFETIDVVKYSSGDTVHLPTAPLTSVVPSMYASDQVPVPGVPMPDWVDGEGASVSYGVIDGTSIGYIYVWDWWTTANLFRNAVYDLRYNKKVDGLILDFRMNYGGKYAEANGGFALLFGTDPTANYSIATRTSTSDHLSFSMNPHTAAMFTPKTDFDHPIAVLIGPGCVSTGDYNAFRLRFHPMARLFGRPTNGAFVGGDGLSGSLGSPDWLYSLFPGSVHSNVPDEGFMIHKGVQPDKEVWLTPEGVAAGEDDVVKKAVEWISTLSYAHDVVVNRDTVKDATDSLRISANVTNPLGHKLSISVYVVGSSAAPADTVLLHPVQDDTVWSVMFGPPGVDGIYNISVCTYDSTSASSRTLPNVASFSVLTGAEEFPGRLPERFALRQNYPNPFNPTTTISYDLSANCFVSLEVYDVLGREVKTLVNEVKRIGRYEVRFDASGLASGVYFYRIKAGSFAKTMKLMVVR